MLQERVRGFARATGTLSRGETYVVGVSGGVDSLALLHALRATAPDLGIGLHVAHLDHGLRGAEAAADARFVDDLARDCGLPATVAAADVGRYARERGLGSEEAARAVRYAFFADLVRHLGAAGVIVGHTADDQVETVLLHFLRGSGLAGLRGMAAVQDLSVSNPARWRDPAAGPADERWSLRVLRPLLGTTRAEVLAYAARYALSYRQDVTNEDVAFTRNRVRRELLPLLETYNPAFRAAALRMAGLLADDYAFLAQAAAAVWDRVAVVAPAAVRVDLAAFVLHAPALRRLIVRRAFALLAGDTADLVATHVEQVVALAERGRTGAGVDLPAGVRVARTYGALVLSVGAQAGVPLPARGVPLRVPGVTAVEPGWQVEAAVRPAACAAAADPRHADFDLDRLDGEIVVRRRRPGDRLRPPGLGGSKKVQDILVDRKVPRWERDAVPVVASGERVLWLVGHAVDEQARASAASRRVLHLRFSRRG